MIRRPPRSTLFPYTTLFRSRAHPHDVGIGRVHAHPRDLLRLGEPEGGPRLAAVGGLPDAVAGRDVAADGILAGADVHDVGVRLRDADRADGAAEVLVGHRRPRVASIRRLENAAARRAHPEFTHPGRGTRDGDAAPTAVDPDLAPLERGEHRGVEALGGRGARWQ